MRGIVPAAAAFLAACAGTAGIQPNQPYQVTGKGLPPYQFHEDCVTLAKGDKLEWSYTAQAPLDFSIQYRDGKALIMPMVREALPSSEGTFDVLVAQDYCLVWEAGARGTLLDYTVHLRRSR